MMKEYEFPDVAAARLIERVSVSLGSEGLVDVTLVMPRRTYESIAKAARLAGEEAVDHLDGVARQIALASRHFA